MKFTIVSAAAVVLAAQQVLAGGPIAGCLQTHIVTAGDSCDGIATAFKLTPDQFYAMNPGLHHAGDHLCDNLDDGKPYCVCTKKPCVAESTTGNSTSTGASSSGAAPSGASSSVVATPSSGATTSPVTTPSSSSSASVAGGSSSDASKSASASASSTHSAANSLVVPTMMLGLVGMAVAALL